MDRTSQTIIWIVIAVIVIIAGIWWYSSMQNTNNVIPGENNQNQAQSSEKSVTSFAIPSIPTTQANVDEANSRITINVPPNTDLTKLSPQIQVSDKAKISPESGTERDFTNPVTYTVTAEDGTTRTYTVIITKGSATNAPTGI